ncbi:site-specific integrase [Domibacillus antri]|uniref:Site-specific integrase n=1 Tax=Domibacillus antri TaxID=1714264 RepID=A0A1Q8Q258_9BACI|nr:site-specific integrase [Domibacillus antri]OLN21433.1 site-specific integrase [Domibacillus antri]
MASFRQRGDKWEYRIVYKDPFTQKKREKTKGGFLKKKEAQLAAREMERQLEDGFEQRNISLKAYLYEWLHEYKKGTVRQNTFDTHENSIKNHIVPYFKELPLKSVTPTKYQKFLNSLHDAGYSRRTVEIVHGTMYGAMKKAVSLRKIQYNPCEGATIKGVEKKREIKFIDSNYISPFLKEVYKYGYLYWIFFMVLIETGMRKGEAGALQWSDINIKERTIGIHKSLNYKAYKSKDPEVLFGDTKTYPSDRTIRISQTLTRALQEHLKYQNQNKLALEDDYCHELNLVLCKNDGTPIPKSSLFNAFKKSLERIDHPRLPIHSLRHTHVVLQMEADANMKYIQERLGHGGIEITSDVYAHLSKKLEDQQMDRYEDYMKDVFAGKIFTKKDGQKLGKAENED